MRRLELPDFEPDGSPPLELLDRLKLLRPDELLEAVRRLPLDELAAFERLPLREPTAAAAAGAGPADVAVLSSPLLLRRLPLRLLCDSRCCLTSPSSMVPRHAPDSASFIMM